MTDDEFDVEIGNPFEKQTVEQKIDALAEQPLVSTGKRPSPEAVEEAKRIAAGLTQGEVQFSENAANWATPDADPDEEPPEPEGHKLTPKVADWIAKGQEFFHGPLPADIAAIWAHPPHRVADEATARILVAVWGMEGFRSSALHRTALAEVARRVNSQEVTARFKSEREKEKKR